MAYRVAIDDLLEWSGSERAERSRGGDDRRLPALVPAARGPCAGDVLPALSPPAQDPPVGLPTRRRPRPIRRPRAAAETAAGARLADPRRVPTPTRRRRPARANLPGLAERDRLALLALVTTGLRRSELCSLDWRDLELNGGKPSLLVRHGKGGKSRRQPLPARLARELLKLRDARQPAPTDPVFCGLAGGRLQETILADIIRRATKRAGIEKPRHRAHAAPHGGDLAPPKRSATPASSPSTSATPTCPPSHATRTSTATNSSKRRAGWSSSPLLRKNPRPRTSRISPPRHAMAPTTHRATRSGRADGVGVAGGEAAVEWATGGPEPATHWSRPTLAGPQNGSQRCESG